MQNRYTLFFYPTLSLFGLRRQLLPSTEAVTGAEFREGGEGVGV